MTAGPARLARRRRAETLRSSIPHAAELLAFLVHVLDTQEAVYAYLGTVPWLASLDDATGNPRLRWDRLPIDELAGRLEEFAVALGRAAPAPVADACHALSVLSPAHAAARLRTWVEEHAAQASPPSPRSDPAGDFVGRAFLQAVAERFAEERSVPPRDGDRTCGVCGGPPVVSLLRDEPEIKGRRLLVCARCASQWGFPRVRCLGCGSEATDKLVYHEAESIAHVRLDACLSCRSYLKAIDLRRDGRAEPYADDVATVELDLWAVEQGLVRLQPNLLGV